MPALPQMAKTGLPFSCEYKGLSVTLRSFNYSKVVRSWTLKGELYVRDAVRLL
jgi:hypothetical protein